MEETVYDLIPVDRYITRKELCNLTGLSDRWLRLIISKIRKEKNIISLSCGKGYRKPKYTNEMTNDDLIKELRIIEHQINENNSRIAEIKKNMRPQIAYLKMIQKKINERKIRVD